MSAPVGTMAEDSSSEDEDLEHFKEAAWSFGTYGTNGTHNANPAVTAVVLDGVSNVKQSRRVAVSKHEHDGNELQTTPEFRAHVAKKLGAMLDSCISVISAETSRPCTESTKCEDGFRLFTTSVPGEFTIDPPPPPVRRRPIPSSSDSDSEMEMRLREAAVSVTDLLSSALPCGITHSLPESPSSEKMKKKKNNNKGEEAEREDHNNSPVPKKNMKRKALQGECGDVEHCGESSPNAKTDEEQKRPEEDILPLKKKKKKKKK
ncbi:protein CUSTOS-like isoform X1 [Salvelinus namaycush]|uniref:Protein CUSTOS n=2 Tax=Salvelinus namaycush TaxID=8040 RepID=A0A8U1C0I0_SALNM|nr:protein CUSTOS-like isoform X1 [Salvelinus namaycush]